MTIVDTGRGFEVTFQYDSRKVEEIKKIDGAWFRGKDRTWIVPSHQAPALSRFKQKFGLKDDDSVISMPEQIEEIPPMPALDISLDIKKTPFPFQETGIAYNRLHERTIIGDQPGLGKTLQLIATVHSLQAYPCLIICPSTLKLNWQKEWLDVAGKRAMILSDRVKNTWQQYHKVGMVDVFIVNYESLKKYFVQSGWSKPKDGQFKINMIPFRDNINLFKSVAIDESHKCKDGSTQQTKFVMGVTKGKKYVYCLTGTPVVNKPKDLISQLHIINRLSEIVSHIPAPLHPQTQKPTDQSGYKRFINRYCAGGRGESNLKELHTRLRKICFYRREKSEVLKDLPEKIRQVILCDIDNRTEYDHAEKRFVDYLKNVKGCSDEEVKKKLRGELMVQIGILKSISAKGKLNSVRDHVEDLLEGGEKVILFCHLKEIARALKEMFPDTVSITGDDDNEARDRAVRRFQMDPTCKVIVCSIKAAGVGLTLTAASNVRFIEFPWTFADCEQCEDRAHRIGQVDSVLAGYFLGENTIDRYCYDLIQKKKSIAMTITGAADDVQEEIIDELLNLFNQR